MNNKEICFISCVNNKEYESEMIRYLNDLRVPDGFMVNQISVYDASSMAAGYNEAMQGSDAKYKIYLHQDVFIIKKSFIQDLLAVFLDETVGMIGMAGTAHMPKTGVMWDGDMIGLIYSSNISQAGESLFNWPMTPYSEVEAADGLLLATQYDIPWRDDLFKGFDFYDISQSYEFRRAGYRVAIPHMGEQPWVFHDSGVLNMTDYERWRQVFINEYFS